MTSTATLSTSATPDLAAAHENTGLARTVTRSAATFLVAKLFRRTVDFAARLGLVGTLLALVELPLDNPVNDVNARLKTENVVRQLNRACLLCVNGMNVGFHVSLTPSQLLVLQLPQQSVP